MEDLDALLEYFKKLQKAIDNAELKILKYKFVKKNRIDDLLVCTLAVLPNSFKKATKKRHNINMFPSVTCYNRLSKIIKRPLFLMPDYYMIDYNEANIMLKSIIQNIKSDIRKLEGL